jgi:hypothetical protein
MALFKTESRIQIIGLFFLLGVSAVIGKLWWVQVVKNEFYKQKVRGSGNVTVRIPSVRGEIRDKNGLVLVGNRPSFSVDFMLDEMVKGYGQDLWTRLLLPGFFAMLLAPAVYFGFYVVAGLLNYPVRIYEDERQRHARRAGGL